MAENQNSPYLTNNDGGWRVMVVRGGLWKDIGHGGEPKPAMRFHHG